MAKGILFLLFFVRLSFRHLICACVAEEGWVWFLHSVQFFFVFLGVLRGKRRPGFVSLERLVPGG